MVRTWLLCFLVSLSVIPLFVAGPVLGEELLVNGDFEIGTPEEDKPDSFACNAWRRLLWRETLPNSWLTNGKLDRPVGHDNQALEFRWGATSICQYFSATAGETYQFSVDYLNPGRPDSRWQPRIQVEWRDADDRIIGQLVTVAEADYATAPAKTWNAIDGSAVAPANTAYGRVLLNVNNKGSGQYFQKTYLDNASVRGVAGTHNLPVSFANSPYDTLPCSVEGHNSGGQDIGRTGDSHRYRSYRSESRRVQNGCRSRTGRHRPHALHDREENSLKDRYLFWDNSVDWAVRDREWKLVSTHSRGGSRVERVDGLFRLSDDIGESKELGGEYPEVAIRLETALEQWRADNESPRFGWGAHVGPRVGYRGKFLPE